MMKLNNKGWGTLEMILISCALLLALIVSIFFISKLYGSLSNSVSNKTYMDLEDKLEDAARRYVNDNDLVITNDYRISYELLKDNGYINSLNDKNNKACNGYVIVNNVDNINYYKGYLSCDNYTTNSY